MSTKKMSIPHVAAGYQLSAIATTTILAIHLDTPTSVSMRNGLMSCINETY